MEMFETIRGNKKIQVAVEYKTFDKVPYRVFKMVVDGVCVTSTDDVVCPSRPGGWNHRLESARLASLMVDRHLGLQVPASARSLVRS